MKPHFQSSEQDHEAVAGASGFEAAMRLRRLFDWVGRGRRLGHQGSLSQRVYKRRLASVSLCL
jgi:hypothetical protein